MENLFDGDDLVYVTCKKCNHEIEVASHANRQRFYTNDIIKGNAFCNHCQLFFQWTVKDAHFKDGKHLTTDTSKCPFCEKKLLFSQPKRKCPYCKKDLPLHW